METDDNNNKKNLMETKTRAKSPTIGIHNRKRKPNTKFKLLFCFAIPMLNKTLLLWAFLHSPARFKPSGPSKKLNSFPKLGYIQSKS